ncbi:MAG: hypothetical protein KDJ38_15420 [Gammaproteobacteria bacterium]|nr:hypothetical protein [Gammaproteobacteria bacterium]
MENLKQLPNEKLRVLIQETESTLTDLKAEMERREEGEQESAINNLDDYMKNAELSLQSIRDFLAILLEDFRSDKAKKVD